MADVSEPDIPFSKWLESYLASLSSAIDPEIYGEYIEGILKDDTLDASEISESISTFIESVFPLEDAVKCSQKIFSHFREQVAESSILPSPVNTVDVSDPNSLDILEETMRSMLPASKDLLIPAATPLDPSDTSSVSIKRDACTVAILRSAGVSGYQVDEQAEAELSINLANAEYVAKQAQGSFSNSGLPLKSLTNDFAAVESEAEDIDMAEIETAQGYGKKEGIQPGNIMEALVALNPDKFGSAEAAKVASTERMNANRQFKRLPTPGDISSSTTSGYILLNTRGVNVGLQENAASGANSISTNGVSPISAGKKKSAPPPKKLADIGARAEEKHKRMLAKMKEKMVACGAAGNRLDDMDAFFISDDESGNDKSRKDILLAGGRNVGRAVEVTKQTRVISGREFVEGKMREKQFEPKREANAQQRTSKMERRRR